MVAKNVATSISNKAINGSFDYVTGTLWRHRISAMKGCLLILFITNMFYFAARYIELTNTVRKLEAERSIGCQNKIQSDGTATTGNEKSEEVEKDEGPQLNYSQVCFIFNFFFNVCKLFIRRLR